ncbi:MAG: DNA repair protein RecO [Candidatus Moranbacteria bacterium RIFOXYB1_FULL_43_19]|nr:MAG: DNA repair protein RecO [Candidatus Moranbacteria bacterium RIFOXYB1_FULL_43_19]OGI32477.1 MAG: DNA repair protein RecO [Candidatus Moranbacteria bacterium RIFOXYC1_FULL_44_13]OGI37633.1 MAG: DNA repair protein RecO [Candidatus Moranbacteria bacterium RIFOXYD1_FULL_44_12]
MVKVLLPGMQKYTAIILASRKANEVNRLYIMYTLEQGLVKAVAKGVRKPNAKLAGHLEPVTLSEVYVARSKGMGQITSAITLETLENIKKDFGKLSEALKIFRFFLKNFSEGEKDERIFKLLCGFLEFLAGKEAKVEILTEAFWWKLFDVLGNRPEVVKCAGCSGKLRADSKKYFSISKGGAVCLDCRQNFEGLTAISDNQIKLLRVFLGNSLEKTAKVKISEKEVEKLAKIRGNYIKYHFS